MSDYPAIESAEHAAATLAAAGMPRMPARVMMALVAAPADGYTAAEIAERLGISPAAVSGALRYLQNLHFTQRRSLPGQRRDRYVLVTDSFYLSVTQNAHVYRRTAAQLDDIAGELDDPPARARAHEMASFFRFLARRMPQLIEEWNTQRGEA